MNRRERLIGQAVGNSARLSHLAAKIAGSSSYADVAAALDRLEARGGWDEADLNDFAIVRSHVSNTGDRPE